MTFALTKNISFLSALAVGKYPQAGFTLFIKEKEYIVKNLLLSLYLIGSASAVHANENSCGSNLEQNAIIGSWLEQNDSSFTESKFITYAMVIQDLNRYDSFLVQVTGLTKSGGFFTHSFHCDNGSIIKIQSVKKEKFSETQDGIHKRIH